MLKKALLTGAALLLSLITLTIVVLLGTVTHTDAVSYSDWIDATKVTDPLPGQLYAISAEGEIVGQLCPLRRDDFRSSIDALPGRTFVNRLGEALPVVAWAAKIYFQTDPASGQDFDIGYRLEWRSLERESAPLSALAVGLQRILHERDMEQIRQQAPAARLAEVERLEGCATTIVQTLGQGLDVCQLTEVIKERSGGVLAVRFATHCLTDPQGGPRRLPELAVGSFWTSVKLGLGLVDQLLAAPVVAGAEAV